MYSNKLFYLLILPIATFLKTLLCMKEIWIGIMPWESFKLSTINYTVFKRKISMQIAKNGLSFIYQLSHQKSLTYDKLF